MKENKQGFVQSLSIGLLSLIIAQNVFTWKGGGVALAADGPGSISAVKLECEHLVNPVAIDQLQPRLSWQLQSQETQARSLTQSAYRILVASTPALLSDNKCDLWDSGRVVSDRSVLIPYQGTPLLSRQDCYWKVKAWDQEGKADGWSPVHHWKMALLKTEDWGASEWIGLGQGEHRTPLSSRLYGGGQG